MILFFMWLILTGCAGGWSGFNSNLDQVGEHAAALADTKLRVAEWASCDDASVGALRRRYHGTNAAVGWQLYCEEVWKRNGETPIEIPLEGE